MSSSPQLHFLRAVNPVELAQKLRTCLFFRRHGGSATFAPGSDTVECSFSKSPSKQQIMQATSMYFGKWQQTNAAYAYGEHLLVQRPAAEPQEAQPMEIVVQRPAAEPQEAQPMEIEVPASQAHAVATRSSVQDIQRLAHGMSMTECRSLAVHFALLGAPNVCINDGVHALLAAKRAAAVAFAGCAKAWPELMAPHVRLAPPPPPMQCQCRCGCDNMVMSLVGCYGPNCLQPMRTVCKQCMPTPSRCHVCRDEPKNTSLAPESVTISRPDPLIWYFNEDWGIVWLRENRDVRLDPPLLDVLRVTKNLMLYADKRKVLPFDWELAFTLRCQLQDPIGGCAEVTINLKAFVQNPVWARHPMVEYIKTWLPSHFEFQGDLWKDRAAYVAPPSPRSPPYINETATWAESTVHIEEVDGQDAGSSSSMCIAPATKNRKL